MADGEHLGEVADVVVGPPGCPVGDGGELVDGEFASPAGVDRFGELGGAAGDGDDLAGPVGCEPGAPGEELLGGVDAIAEPERVVGEHRDGQVDQACVLGVEVACHVVERIIEIQRLSRLDGGVNDGGCHGMMIVRTYEEINRNTQMFDSLKVD